MKSTPSPNDRLWWINPLTKQPQEVAVYGVSVIILIWNSHGELQQEYIAPSLLFPTEAEAIASL